MLGRTDCLSGPPIDRSHLIEKQEGAHQRTHRSGPSHGKATAFEHRARRHDHLHFSIAHVVTDSAVSYQAEPELDVEISRSRWKTALAEILS
jgi:hypothetical protein